jgi:hypothetical protein
MIMSYYFLPEPQREGTCYYEFYAGPWHRRKMEFWREDSIVISDLNFSFTGLEKLIAQVIPCFDAYGITPVTKAQWEIITQKATESGGELALAVSEAQPWVQDNFQKHDIFTILGL